MDTENTKPIVGFRVGTYVQGKTSVASINNITNVPQRMKDVVYVRYYVKKKITMLMDIYHGYYQVYNTYYNFLFSVSKI